MCPAIARLRFRGHTIGWVCSGWGRYRAGGVAPRGARHDAMAAGMGPRTRVRARMRPHERACVQMSNKRSSSARIQVWYGARASGHVAGGASCRPPVCRGASERDAAAGDMGLL
eukprot:4987110-Prymnesium_polylepis.2